MKRINFGALLFNILMAAFFGLIGSAFGLNAYAVSGTVLTAGVIFSEQVPGFAMAIQREIWQNDIVGNLFKANPFMNYAFNGDQYVNAGKIVHIPTAGAKPTVVRNRSSLPATIVKRTDVDVVYVLAEYTTDPIVITNAEEVETSYDKRQSVTSEHYEVLFETVGDWMLKDWFTGLNTTQDGQLTGNIVRTTGGAVEAHLPSATGNRKAFVKADLKKARTLMNKLNIPKNDRFALFDSDMFDQLMDDPDLVKRDGQNGGELNLRDGVIYRLYGFDILERSSVLTFTNDATPVVVNPGTAGAAAHNAAVLCWQMNSVERSLGEVKFFEDTDNPEYYGDIYSALLRAGGRPRRIEGVVAIVQDASA